MSNRLCSVPDCGRSHNARGYCFGHYERWKKLGHPDAERPLNTHVSSDASMRDRLMRRVDSGLSEDECWEWRGALGGAKRSTGLGYGKFTVSGRQYDAHRISWELHNGRPIPAGMHVLHDCDNPPCINPRHLRLGSNDENVGDMVSKWRHTYGERNPGAILTERDVRAIRSSGLSTAELAAEYGVTRSTISGVLARRSWKHVS